LRIRAQSSDGIWGKDELTIPLEIKKPFYLYWWFTILVLGASLGLVYSYIQYRTRNLKKAKQALENTVNDRTKQLSSALEDRELLLKEVHHRVKNNLQVISSLFDLQLRNLKDDNAVKALEIAKLRLRSVALIHESLYQNEAFKEIGIEDLVVKLFKQVSQVYEKGDKSVVLNEKCHDIHFNLNTTLSLGLMLNELITNSFKYAFDDQPNPEINISISHTPGAAFRYHLIYQDNGKGLPEGFDPANTRSLGMNIIHDLAQQLKGKLTIDSANGLRYDIKFNGIKN
jgi:two-component sensor histidine kinase